MVLPLLLIAPWLEAVFAFVLLLISTALGWFLGRAIAIMVGNIPVIGSKIADAARAGIAAVQAWATGWARTGLGAFLQLLAAPVQRLVDFFSQLLATVDTVVARILDLFATVTEHFAWAIAQVVRLAGRITALAASFAHYVLGVPALVVALVSPLIAAAVRVEHLALLAVRAALAAAITAEHAALLAAEGNAAKALAAQAAVAAAALSAAIAAARAAATAQAAAVARDVAGVAATIHPIAAAAAAAAVLPIAAELSQLNRECIQPTCSVISPQLGLLQSMLTGELLVLVGLMVEEAIRDPRGAAKEVAGATAGIVGGATALATTIAGIAL